MICGREITIDQHHVGEETSKTTFEGLAPVCPTHNAAIERGKPSGLDPDAEPGWILSQGRAHQLVGKYEMAYGCGRIAAHLFARRGLHAQAAESLVLSISALRPSGEKNLIHDTCWEFLRLLRRPHSTIADLWKAEFLSKVALVLYDFGQPADGVAFDTEAMKFYSAVRAPELKEQVEMLKARASKRSILIRGSLARSAREMNNYLSAIEEAGRISYRYLDWGAYGSALWVHASLLSAHRQTSQARDAIEKALEKNVRRDVWSYGQLLGYLGKLRLVAGEKKGAILDLNRSRQLLAEHRIKPIPIPMDGDLIDSDPVNDLILSGQNDVVPLRGRGDLGMTRGFLRQLLGTALAV